MGELLPTVGLAGTEMLSILNISRAVVSGGSLAFVLDEVAREAARIVGTGSSRILLSGGPHGFRIASNFALSTASALRFDRLREGTQAGPASVAIERGEPVAIEDLRVSREFRPWCEAALEEGYQAMLLVPMIVDERGVGAISVMRALPGPWPVSQIDVLRWFAVHAAFAIRTAELVERQARDLSAIDRVVDGLQAQAHEHANRLHAIGGLLALGDVEAAGRFIDGLMVTHALDVEQITSRISERIIAAMLVAERSTARQKGVSLVLTEHCNLLRLPARISDADAVTILGNLIDNAVGAVETLPPGQHTVTVGIVESPDELLIEVTNPLAPDTALDPAGLFTRGYTTKAGHAGLGLSLVEHAVDSAGGTIDVRTGPTVTFSVRIPYE